MKYKEYLISNKLLNIYTKWLSLCNIAHIDKTFELFYKDFVIWYIFNKCISEQFPKGFLDNINYVEFKVMFSNSSSALLMNTFYNSELIDQFNFMYYCKNTHVALIDVQKEYLHQWKNFNIYLDDLSRNRII